MGYDIYPGLDVAYVYARLVEVVSDDQAIFATEDAAFLGEAGIETGGRIDIAVHGLGRAARELGYGPGDAAMLAMESRTGILLELSSPGADLMETWDAERDTVVNWWICVECGDRVRDRRVHWAGPDGEDGPYCYGDMPVPSF